MLEPEGTLDGKCPLDGQGQQVDLDEQARHASLFTVLPRRSDGGGTIAARLPLGREMHYDRYDP
jgi:hypothetical protein